MYKYNIKKNFSKKLYYIHVYYIIVFEKKKTIEKNNRYCKRKRQS